MSADQMTDDDTPAAESLVKLARNNAGTERALELLKQGCDPDERDHQGMTGLHWAAKTGNVTLVLGLIDARADIHLRDMHDNTPLFYAVLRHSAPTVKLLLDAGANPNCARKNGVSPLHISARQNYGDIAKLLVAYGVDCNAFTELGETPLHLSVDSGSKDLVNCLIEAGANAAMQMPNGDTALHLLATAIIRNRNPANLDSRIDIMVELLDSYDACNITNEQGQTPLDIIGKEFMRSQSPDLCVIVKTFLEMKLKQSEETFSDLLFGIAKRNKYYGNTLPTMLPYLNPYQLIVCSIKPLAIHLKGISFLYENNPARRSHQTWKRSLQPGQCIGSAEQFLRQSRMLCEVGCVPPQAGSIEGLAEDVAIAEFTDEEQQNIMEAVEVWRSYTATGPSLQTLARNSIRRAMVNIRQESFHQLPVPPRIRDYVAMSDLRSLEY